jgi:hypothetical protein
VSRYARWWCKLPGCHVWGLGGPRGWNAHHYDKHQTYPHQAHLSADVAFGFAPDNGLEVRA